MTAFGHVQPKYLCGNMPSFDHLKFAGLENRSDVNLLFAASGDLRNIISTINGTAGSFTVKVVANDREPYIAIRNLMLLLLLGSKSESSLDDDKEAASRLHIETAIHLWFSAMLRPDMAQALRQLCAEKLDKIRAAAGKPGAAGSTLIGTTVQLSNGCTVRCIFTRNDWKTLFAMLDSANITAAKATTSRHGVTQAPERLDYRDRHLDIIRPAHRNSKVQYWRDGMVLPFSVDRSEYSVPNL